MRNTAIIIIVILLLVGGYVLYTNFGGKPAQPVLKSSGQISQSDSTFSGKDFVKVLVSLKSVKLDDAVLNDSQFKSLRDFSVKLQPQEMGRSNPFALISAQ